MENLIIESTNYTPQINFDYEIRILSITGKSYPENTFEFYTPVMEWIKNYMNIKTQEQTVVNIELAYLNSSSLKVFFDLFDLFETNVKDGHNIQLNWIFDEEDDVMEEMGEDFQEDFEDLKINFISK
ncbi:MAG: DUF1987 domain-containing protein [Campylobacterota bacterium]|nr:DUF1987 domain-containing protein [Campylobacterota bacterium]